MKPNLIILCAVFLTVFNTSYSQPPVTVLQPTAYFQPMVTLLQPSVGQESGDSIFVQCSVSVFPSVDSVIVYYIYPYRQIRLSYDPGQGLYSGFFPLKGLPDGEIILRFLTYARNPVEQSYVTSQMIIVHNSLLGAMSGPIPQLVVEPSPAYSVARPTLHFKAKATDGADSCHLILSLVDYSKIYTSAYTIIGEYWDSVETELDLSAYEGQQFGLVVEAIGRHQRTAAAGPFFYFVESSPALTQFYAAPGSIVDFNYNKVLVVDNRPFLGGRIAAFRPRLLNVITGDSSIIPYTGLTGKGYVTAQGAVFSGNKGGGADTLYEFTNNILHSLGTMVPGSLKVAGNYCIWSSQYPNYNRYNDSLYVRDLSTGQTTLVSGKELIYYAYNPRDWPVGDVTAEGVVVYTDSAGNAARYFNHTYQSTTDGYFDPPPSQAYLNPLTDGHSIVCINLSELPQNLSLIDSQWNRHDLTLSTRDYQYHAGTDYQVNNRYIAYQYHPLEHVESNQIHLIYPSGRDTVLTPLSPSSLDLLNSVGELTFLNSSKRKLFSDGQITTVGSALGQPFYRAGRWYIALGRVLFQLPLTTSGTAPAKPELTGLDTTYCRNEGTRHLKITNYPGSTDQYQVLVRLDAAVLSVDPADSSFSFDVSNLSAGSHTIIVTFTNAMGSDSIDLKFSVSKPVTPDVRLSANTADNGLFSLVTIKATNVAGGGVNPFFTFAKNRNFTSIMKAKGFESSLTITPYDLSVGDNWLFVQMRTSETCYTTQTATDSINIQRNASHNGITDPDYPGQVISVYPNPFEKEINISGLSSSKSYTLTLSDVNGRNMYSRSVSNSNTATIVGAQQVRAVYFLKIYDDTKKQLLGTIRLVKGW